MKVLALILALAVEPNLPTGVSCAQIRALVAEHGYFRAVIWARSHGYSWYEIKEAKRCLRS